MTTILRVGILTASDRASQGLREDQSGELLKSLAQELPSEVLIHRIVPDEAAVIADAIIHMVDLLFCNLILTTGGTGLGLRDVTPEATKTVIRQEIPGIAEAIRMGGMRRTPAAMLSRGVAGIRGETLIINLPGSPKAVGEGFEIVRPVIRHAIELLQGKVKDCQITSHLAHSH